MPWWRSPELHINGQPAGCLPHQVIGSTRNGCSTKRCQECGRGPRDYVGWLWLGLAAGAVAMAVAHASISQSAKQPAPQDWVVRMVPVPVTGQA